MHIAIKEYSKKLSNNLVLDNINLELESGKIYGFVGKNGSGKTMLMRAVCGLILPTSGAVIIDEKTIGKELSFPQSVGALIENPGFISGYSGFRNLKVLSQIQNKISDDDILRTLAEVGLDPLDKKPFRKYSLGMKQKLGIAAAIMENPELIVLDEPYNALDEETAAKIRQLILERKRRGNLIILSCHDREEIENTCDEIIEIKCGKITGIKQISREEGEKQNDE